ncbi:MAG: 3-hydroxyacyl-CoA dehydrogenase NAD-binding domain-containing protein [Hyphomicrobiaceae bacterium]
MTPTLPNLKDWHFNVDREHIAWAVFDRENQNANALGRRPIEELGEIVTATEEGVRNGTVKGLVFLSAKPSSFIVGADINEFETLATEADVYEGVGPVNALLDRLENIKVPVVAGLHGACVGGGLELILACHYRIATRDAKTKVGFPEVKLGIFPGFNGTARSIRQAGPVAAMTHMLTGKMISSSAGRRAGYIDQLVDTPDRLKWAARKAVLSKRRSKPAGRALRMLTKWPARRLLATKMRKQTALKAREAHYPAPFRLIDLFEKHGGSEAELKAHETRYFAPLMISDTSRNLRRVFKLTELLKAEAPRKLKWKPSRTHVIGAGTMGADIAGWCVANGMEVTLQDLSVEQLEKGIKSQSKLFKRKFKTKALRDAAKARLISDPDGHGIARADIIIEAIVENLEIKQSLFKDLETKIKDGAVLATNTSSLKLEDIAQAMKDPGRLIGIHYFNPVALMPLVEVVRGEQSHQENVEKGAKFVAATGKFPLITASVPGFLVNRILAPYMMAALSRVDNGEDKNRIDEAAKVFGMPMGPIELADSVGLDVCANVGQILNLSGENARLERLVESGRLGKKTGEGFYVWKDGRPDRSDATQYSASSLEAFGRELVEPIIVEAQKALDENVVPSHDHVDAGVIFGTGFAPFRGGPLHYKATRDGTGEPTRSSMSTKSVTAGE